MFGLILCGGKSSRMGTDKGLLKLEAKTWAQTAVDKFSELSIPVKLSVNKDQYAEYSSVFPIEDLIIDDEILSLRGPLQGLLSAHLKNPKDSIFLLACDMPLMETEVLKELLHYYNENANGDAFIYTNDGEPEPLCGIYKSAGLSDVLKMLQSGQLSKHSMKFMLEHINTFSFPLREEQKKCFRNFNAHAELNGM